MTESKWDPWANIGQHVPVPDDEPPSDPGPFARDAQGNIIDARAAVVPIRPGIALPGERPVIRLGPELAEVADATIAALAADPDLYQQAGQLVRVVRLDPSEATPEKPSGTPEIRPVAVETLREQCSRFAVFEKFDSRRGDKEAGGRGEWVRCAPPKDIAAAILKRGEWLGIRPLDSITEGPLLRPDGSILDTPGYDAATRVLYLPGFKAARVRDAPTKEHATRALAELLKLIEEIPFAKDEQRYVFLAALLTLFTRPAVKGPVPAMAFDASTPGSGKSLCVQVISCIHGGRPSEPNTYPADPVELEKSLGGEAMSGASLIDFDNIEDPVEGGPLLKCLTAIDKVRLRIMGVNTKISIRWRPLVLLGGNNLEIGRQMARRTLVARIEPKEENPDEREGFAIEDLPSYALEHRPRLIAAVFTIVRAWFAAGRPQGAKRIGGYPAWSVMVPQIIFWASGVDVTKCKVASGPRRDDPERAAIRALLPLWESLNRKVGGLGMTTRDALDVLYPGGMKPQRVERGSGMPIQPDGWDAMRAAIEALCHPKGSMVPTPYLLGIRFRRYAGAWYGSQRLVNVEDTDGKNPGRWLVEHAK